MQSALVGTCLQQEVIIVFLGSLVLSGSGLHCRDGQNLGEVDSGGIGRIEWWRVLLGFPELDLGSRSWVILLELIECCWIVFRPLLILHFWYSFYILWKAHSVILLSSRWIPTTLVWDMFIRFYLRHITQPATSHYPLLHRLRIHPKENKTPIYVSKYQQTSRILLNWYELPPPTTLTKDPLYRATQ